MRLLLTPYYALSEIVATMWAAVLIVRLDNCRTRLAALERDLDRARLTLASAPAAFKSGPHADVCRLEAERDTTQKRRTEIERKLAGLGFQPPRR